MCHNIWHINYDGDNYGLFSTSLGLDNVGLTVEINKSTHTPATNILDVLERLDKLGKNQNKRIVLLFDEFQRVYQISKDQALESIIRQVAQASKHLVFIFSGSNRHILHKMFSDRNRPFYKLCDCIILERISEQDYFKYIKKAAQKEDVSITDKEIQQILIYTERHPYYLNLLCSRLWRINKISLSQVSATWVEYLQEERYQGVMAQMHLEV